MSVTAHEAEAARERESWIADAYAARFDPDAGVIHERCKRGICWTSVTNPTGANLEEAHRHRELAAAHRAASRALLDAEARACSGVSAADRDMSPFAHKEDIEVVAILRDPWLFRAEYRDAPAAAVGAVIRFHGVAGMTVDGLQRIVDCHLARNAALGHDVPEMPYCPLVLKGVTAKVTATFIGFDVAVRAPDRETGEEIVRRAEGLAGRYKPVTR